MIGGISGSSSAGAEMYAIWKNMLKKADQDGDGKISKDEFKALIPQNGKGPSVDDVFGAVDTNADGYIDAAETETALKSAQKPPPPGKPDPAAMFQEADTDGDGLLSKAEFTAMHESREARKPEQAAAGNKPSADEMFADADNDGDGSLSMAEFTAMGEAMRARIGGGPGGMGKMGSAGGAGGFLLQAVSNQTQQSGSSTGSSSTNPADANGDGTVTLKELIAYYEAQRSQTAQTTATQTGNTLELVA